MPRKKNESGSLSATRENAPIIVSWALVIAVAAFIFFMSAHTGSQLDHDTGIISLVKAWLAQTAEQLFGHQVDISPIGHFTEFLIFGAALANALRFHLPLRRAALCALALASAYGVTDELHQILVPTRSCDPTDWIVDTVAAAIGSLLVFLLLGKRTHRFKQNP